MRHGLLTAACYEDPEKILVIESTMRKLLMAALQRRNLRLTLRNGVVEGLYRGCTWCLTDTGLACVLRISGAENQEDSAIDVSQIEAIETN